MLMQSSEIMVYERALHIYVHIYTYMNMLKALYQNTIFEFDIGIASPFLGMALNAFGKRALHIHIYLVFRLPL